MLGNGAQPPGGGSWIGKGDHAPFSGGQLDTVRELLASPGALPQKR